FMSLGVIGIIYGALVAMVQPDLKKLVAYSSVSHMGYVMIGLFSLRVRAIFFAMVTLAVASAFAILAAQLSDITGGEDGRSFRVPEMLRPGFTLVDLPLLGPITGRTVAYYIVFLSALVLFLGALRIVNSPFGRVLQAIRENEFRAEAIGYRVVVFRTTSSILSALFATLAGAMLAIWLRYNGPDTSLSFEVMLDVLLIVVIGGMGTVYGAAIGSGLFIAAQSYLQDLLKLASDATSGLPWLSALLSPDRWLLWLGLLFVLSVYHFPTGIVGRLRATTPTPRRPGIRPEPMQPPPERTGDNVATPQPHHRP
ncbi:MAG: ABC transporter permease subunit, partial [Ramlibacter sp.]